MVLTPMEEEAARRMLQAEQQRAAEAQLDAIVSVHARIYDKAVAYTNAVILGGYVALFAAWGFVQEFINSSINAIAGALIVASCLTFVLWEVYKGTVTGRAYSQVSNSIAKEPTEAVRLLLAFEKAQLKKQLMRARLWYLVIAFSLSTGLGAAGIIAYGFLVHLFGTDVSPD